MTIQLEAWSSREASLSSGQAKAVAESGLVRVEIDEPPDRWRLDADSRIGIVAGDEWEVRVVPRLDIPQLMFLLGYAADPKGWRDIGPTFAVETHLSGAVANGFAVHAERSVNPAPIRGYVTVDDRATTLRGRVRVADQMARWPGLPLPLELSFDEFNADVPENRLLRGAAELLLRLPRIPALTRQRLMRLGATLEEACPQPPSPHAESPEVTSLNSHYKAAMKLAELVLRGCSISTRRGTVESIAFVFDMNKVFEDFLSAALTTALERRGGRVALQHSREHLDLQGRIKLKPDITWWQGGVCRAVIDAKYKPLTDARFPNADAYQMLAYCTALGLDDGYLVYARDAGEGERDHDVRNAQATIHVRAVDVGAAHEALLEQVDALAAELAAA